VSEKHQHTSDQFEGGRSDAAKAKYVNEKAVETINSLGMQVTEAAKS